MSVTLQASLARALNASVASGVVKGPVLSPAEIQTAAGSFQQSNIAGYDGTLALQSTNLSSATKQLNVSLELKANRTYTFSAYYPSGGPSVWLVDSRGKKTAVDMRNGFKAPKSGNYTLRFEAGYSLRDAAGLQNIDLRYKNVLPTSSGDKKLDALLNGGTTQWWHSWNASVVQGSEKINSASALASGSSATTISFSFLSSQPAAQSMTGFQEMTAAQKDAVRRAFAYYGKLINVNFTEVAGDGTGQINFGTNQQASSAGYANLPGTSGVKDKAYLYLANNQASNGDAGMAEGGYGYLTVLHEIGHTLGLKHPGNYNAGGGGTPGPYLPSGEDNRQRTMMSYYDNTFSRGVNASTAGLYDVAALQYLYGANKGASNATNGAFVFTPDQSYLKTLWSASGNDTIDLSAMTRSSEINLNAGTFSSINIIGPSSAQSYSGNQNVAIAYGSKINQVTLSAAAGVKETVTLNNAYATGGVNTLNNFDASTDVIALRKAYFGTIKAKNIQIGTNSAAANRDARIVVNTSTGEVFYDADGSGRKAAKKIAQFSALAAGGGTFEAKNLSFVA